MLSAYSRPVRSARASAIWVAVLESGRADQRCNLADDAVGGIHPRGLKTVADNRA